MLGLVGTLAVVAALLAEWQWGVDLAVVQGSVVIPAIWRLTLHLGAAMLLWQAVTVFLRPGARLAWMGPRRVPTLLLLVAPSVRPSGLRR